jgi:NAD+-dependent protein deacetylase sirtuin 6
VYARECDNKSCIVCARLIGVGERGGIVTVPSKRLSRLSASTIAKFRVSWNKIRLRDFVHSSCWAKVVGDKSLNRSEQLVVSEADETLEEWSSLAELRARVEEVATLLRTASRTVCFTGAGVSVASGLPTYRGTAGIDTIAALCSSGAGAHGDQVDENEEPVADAEGRKRKLVDLTSEDEGEDEVDYTALVPSLTHTSLASLHRAGKLQYCITQNCDGLHQKGGLPRSCVSDLHGSVFEEFCEDCGKQYSRDYCVDAYSTSCTNEPWFEKCSTCGWNHYTGRRCSVKNCRGKLRDTIVNFGDDLHERVCGGLPRAEEMAAGADVCLALGTSLTVSPANSLPRLARRLVIVNLQATELDDRAHVRVWAKSDDFFRLLMPELGLSMQ